MPVFTPATVQRQEHGLRPAQEIKDRTLRQGRVHAPPPLLLIGEGRWFLRDTDSVDRVARVQRSSQDRHRRGRIDQHHLVPPLKQSLGDRTA
ncbi:hypothetical protein Stube_69030 [Streptomyces tubercidicus]|uniref:Uncharacterized protein n=1 Tax=Streptomyces tubercidicus TaxID=47759 RepID=A0A640V4C7_9ACTN|nr:hypothetical protein Stube_69030 [Streptomyces tubercidicus]